MGDSLYVWSKEPEISKSSIKIRFPRFKRKKSPRNPHSPILTIEILIGISMAIKKRRK